MNIFQEQFDMESDSLQSLCELRDLMKAAGNRSPEDWRQLANRFDAIGAMTNGALARDRALVYDPNWIPQRTGGDDGRRTD